MIRRHAVIGVQMKFKKKTRKQNENAMQIEKNL